MIQNFLRKKKKTTHIFDPLLIQEEKYFQQFMQEIAKPDILEDNEPEPNAFYYEQFKVNNFNQEKIIEFNF